MYVNDFLLFMIFEPMNNYVVVESLKIGIRGIL